MKDNIIYCGNCVDILKCFDDEVIDLTITSPPYDNLRTYKGSASKNPFLFKEIAEQIYRVTKKGGVVVWIVGDGTINGSETGSSFRQALFFNEIGFKIHDTMIYEKNSISYPAKNRYYQIFEYMFVFSKGKPKTTNLIKDRKNRWAGHHYWGDLSTRNKEEQLVKKTNTRVIPEFSIRNNIWRYNTGKGFSTKSKIAHKHPAIFPEKLAEDHILSWSNEGDIVLDPMCGSGTTLKMARLNKRKYIGIDIVPEYCSIAEERIGENI